MTLAEILAIEGITVRRIPFQTVQTFAYTEKYPLKANQTRFTYQGKHGSREMVREISENRLGGKYLVRITTGQGSTVQFSIKHDGIGDTVEEAYSDYLTKRSNGHA